MADVILVLNAGSSSIKFSAFDAQSPDLALVSRGQAEGLFGSPRFAAFDARGETRISTATSKVGAWVIPTNEELMIARHARSVMDRASR
ncbi:hypothetical protein [Caballeronia sp. GAWG1-5s-s]|uniref:hypothetical protein n=1 Tax=unclassified Caballeronia TaxID=2646786 RepID=UPI0032EC4A5F